MITSASSRSNFLIVIFLKSQFAAVFCFFLTHAVSSDSFPYIVYPVRHKPIHKAIATLKRFKKNPFFHKGIKRGLY